MFKKKYVLVAYLIFSMGIGNAFAAGPSGSVESELDQPEAIEMTVQQMEEGTAGTTEAAAQTGMLAKFKKFFGGPINKKKVAAITVAGVMLGGMVVFAASPYIWPECKMIYDAEWKVCSFDKGDMIKVNPGVPMRGMYLSPWTDEIQNPIANDKYVRILGNEEKENQVLSFIDRNGIDSISLYNLGLIFDTSGLSPKLANFIVRLKEHGVKQVTAIGHTEFAFHMIADFQKRYPGRFDALLTEVEFWHDKVSVSKAYEDFRGLLKHVRGLGMKNIISGKDAEIGVYVGYLNRVPDLTEEEIAEELLTRADHVYQHCYGSGDATSTHDPVDAYRDCGKRMKILLATRERLSKELPNMPSRKVTPILSFEGSDFYQIHGFPSEHYMGNWIAANPNLNTLDTSMDEVIRQYHDPALLTGKKYYEYSFLDYQMEKGLKNQTQSQNQTQPH